MKKIFVKRTASPDSGIPRRDDSRFSADGTFLGRCGGFKREQQRRRDVGGGKRSDAGGAGTE